MKKVLLGGIAALAVVLATDRPASAWINSKFSVGLNWAYQSGGNNLLWGLFRNGQPPGPEAYGNGHHAPPFQVAPFPYFGGVPNGAPHGGNAYGSYGNDGAAPAMMPTTPPPPAGDARTPPSSAVAHFHPAVWHTPAAYQPVSYYSSPYYPYPQYTYPQYAYPQYAYPAQGAYGSWGAPQYWGR
jgi:hypothetical protein